MRTSSFLAALAGAVIFTSSPVQAQVTTGLQLWLKADDLTNTVSPSKVSWWTNSAGLGFDATNGAPATQPTYLASALNGRPVVRFTDDGSNVANNTNLNWLVSPLPLSANSNSFTAIVVFDSQVSGQRDTLIQQLGNGTTLLYVETNAVPTLNPRINSFASGKELPSWASYTTRSWLIMALVQDTATGTVTLYQNGFALTNTTIGATATLANAGWLFGCNKNKSTHGLNGDLAEVMIYDTALSAGDVGATTYYLAQKYGFVVLTDSYDTADTWDLNADLATRQSGSAAPAEYFWQQAAIESQHIKADITSNPFNLNWISEPVTPKVNFLTNDAGGNFQFSFDITNFTHSGANFWDSWVGFLIRSPFTLAGPNATGFGSILFNNGARQDFIDGNMIGGAPFGTPTNNFHVDLRVANNVLTYVVNGQVLAVYNLPCPAGGYITLTVGGVPTSLPITCGFDNFSFNATPLAPPILPRAGKLQLADSFATPDTTDLNANLATRQSGAAAPVPYVTTGNFNASVAIAGNAVVITNQPTGEGSVGMFSPSADFRPLEHLNSFRLRFRAFGTNETSGNDSWIGLRFRDTRVGRFVASEGGGGNAINFFPDGRWYFFLTNSMLAYGTVPMAASYQFELDVRTNLLRMTINGQPLLLGCGADAYALPPTQAANFLTFQCLASSSAVGAYAWFDIIEFTALDAAAAVPSPLIKEAGYGLAGADPAFRFSFDSVKDVFYSVEGKGSFATPGWNYLGGLVGTGGSLNFTNTPATNAAGFYRLRVP